MNPRVLLVIAVILLIDAIVLGALYFGRVIGFGGPWLPVYLLGTGLAILLVRRRLSR
ncbi:MAG: hypothetical protein JSS81_23030 [Acidobacteria bacterium]|nr:hypothetical protein [Acidobacteriota bacterium]